MTFFMNPTARIALFIACLFCMVLAASHTASAAQDAPTTDLEALKHLDGPEDRQLEPWRRDLLELAFDSVTKMPLNPHIKNRARAQQKVVEACLELGQADLALYYIRQMPNWRRGLCYALYAQHAIDRGHTKGISDLLTRALAIGDDASQAWRRHRVRAAVGRARIALGQTERASEIADQIDAHSEQGKLAAAEAAMSDEMPYKDRVATFNRLLASPHMEVQANGVEGLMQLYDQYYEKPDRRDTLSQTLWNSFRNLPTDIGVEHLFSMAYIALAHDDREHAKSIADHLDNLFNAISIEPIYLLPLKYRLAKLYYLAGEQSDARQMMRRTMAFYNRERDDLLRTRRAGILRTAADTYLTFGDHDSTMKTYRRAVEEGSIFESSRPRATDLSETCLALALSNFKPDDDMVARLHDINTKLGSPW